MKLVFKHNWGGEPCGGTSHIPFEYENKDKFVFDMLDKYKNFEWEYYGNTKSEYETNQIYMFGCWLTKGELEDIEHNIFTLDEWFNIEHVKIE